jgi:hypothetical protein
MCVSHYPHLCYMSHQSHFPSYDYHSRILWRVQFTKLTLMLFYSFCYYVYIKSWLFIFEYWFLDRKLENRKWWLNGGKNFSNFIWSELHGIISIYYCLFQAFELSMDLDGVNLYLIATNKSKAENFIEKWRNKKTIYLRITLAVW